VYITGFYDGTVDFDPGPSTFTMTTNGSSGDVFIQKLDANGNFIWAKSMGGTSAKLSRSITTDASGNVYITGYFESSVVDFDPGPGTFNLSSNGNDDVFVLKLSQCATTTGTETVTACGNFTWSTDGNMYASTGTYTATLINSLGCDSIVTLNLTVNNPTTGSQTLTICAGSSITVGTSAYSTSGIFTDILAAVNGCDSIVTTNLTVSPSITGSESVTVCDSYIWPADGNMYTSTGTYTATLASASGCDSTITLNLTINTVDTTLMVNDLVLTSAISGASYQWIDCNNSNTPISGATNSSYTGTANGSYALMITANGCTDTSSCYAILTTGLTEKTFSNMLTVFPNPTTDQLTVDLGATRSKVTVEVRNLIGQLMLSTDPCLS